MCRNTQKSLQAGPLSRLRSLAPSQPDERSGLTHALRVSRPTKAPTIAQMSDGTKEAAMPKSKHGGYGVKTVRGPFVRLPPHELACETDEEMLAVAAAIDRPLAVDLFCGAGGLSLGLQAAGFEVVLGVDHDPSALDTHRAYHPGLSVNWDLGDPDVIQRVVRLVKRSGATVVAGGPPCQPFSRAGRSMMRDLVRLGRRPEHDQRRDLWESFLQVVEEARPQAVIMENVPDMALDRGMIILRAMVERLEALDYTVEERVVETWRYGVPQFRQRLILVAVAKNRPFEWPEEASLRVTVQNAIGDLPSVRGGDRPENGQLPDPRASGWWPYGGPQSEFQKAARVGVLDAHRDRIFDHITRPVRDDDAKAFASMDHSTRYSDLDASLKRYRDDIFDDKYKRLDPNDVSRTITAHIAKDGYWYIHPYQDRTITVREAARLQTFPDHVRFAGPPSAAFKQIGNAVPPLLGQRIGEALLDALDQKPDRLRPTTTRVSEELAIWFTESAPSSVPWLGATVRWQVIQAELLWGRVSQEAVRSAWVSVRSLMTPDKTLAGLKILTAMARQWNREDRISALEETAHWMAEHPGLLSPSVTAAELMAGPNISQSISDLACRVVPGETEDPILAGFGVLRVAARFSANPVDRKNKLTDGRLAVARMVGGDETSHDAHLALIELAAGVCGPKAPRCGECPLSDLGCATAATLPQQATLGITSRAS